MMAVAPRRIGYMALRNLATVRGAKDKNSILRRGAGVNGDVKAGTMIPRYSSGQYSRAGTFCARTTWPRPSNPPNYQGLGASGAGIGVVGARFMPLSRKNATGNLVCWYISCAS